MWTRVAVARASWTAESQKRIMGGDHVRPGVGGCDRPAGLRDGEAARESGEKCGDLAESGK